MYSFGFYEHVCFWIYGHKYYRNKFKYYQFLLLLDLQVTDYSSIVLHHLGKLPHKKSVLFFLTSWLCFECLLRTPDYDSLSSVYVFRYIKS